MMLETGHVGESQVSVLPFEQLDDPLYGALVQARASEDLTGEFSVRRDFRAEYLASTLAGASRLAGPIIIDGRWLVQAVGKAIEVGARVERFLNQAQRPKEEYLVRRFPILKKTKGLQSLLGGVLIVGPCVRTPLTSLAPVNVGLGVVLFVADP